MRTKQEIITEYKNAAKDVAEFISRLRSYKESFEWISNQTMDNADPECDAADCLEKLGGLLATLIIYANEYEEELKKESSKNEN
jgi:NTP pyrophosphatase (non-canonical NTP hydrolase)